MEVTLALVALVCGLVALWLVVPVRREVSELSIVRRELDEMRGSLARIRGDLDQTGRDLEQARAVLERQQRELAAAQRELGELKAATEVVPAPPLPKARPTGLEDLRERLRAAHRESTDEPSSDE